MLQFQENLMSRFTETFESLNFEPKNVPRTPLPTQEFSSTKSSVTFMRLLNLNFLQKIKRKVTSQSWENGVTDEEVEGRRGEGADGVHKTVWGLTTDWEKKD